MAWSIPTYGGVAAHGRPSNLRLAMFELIRGIDERTEALGYNAQYTWWTAASTSASAAAPTFDDLEFLKCTGNKSGGTAANANKAYRNMVLITDRIIGMLDAGRFVTDSGGTTKYTQSSMESAIGTTLEYPVAVTEARWWQSIQDALDLMIHAWSAFSPTIGSVFGTSSDSETTSQDAWDGRTANAPIGGIGIGYLNYPLAAWRMNETTGNFIAYEVASVSANFDIDHFVSTTNPIQGVVSAAWYEIESLQEDASFADFEIDVSGDPVVSSATESTLATATITLGTVLIARTISLVSSPSTTPFTGPGFIGIQVAGINVQHDLSTILTDQA